VHFSEKPDWWRSCALFESDFASKASGFAELPFNPQQLVELGYAFSPATRAGFDLSSASSHC
jgi:hypothetical protein